MIYTFILYIAVFKVLKYRGYISVISIIFGSVALAYATTNASRVMHARLVRRILRVPMTFFNTTPLGRVMNRCSKDVDTLDTMIPYLVRLFLYVSVPLIAVVVVVSYSTPIFLVVVLPIGLLYFFVQVISLDFLFSS